MTGQAGALAPSSSWTAFREDARKIPAFFRRDLLVLWSYRVGFFSDWINLVVQVLVFYFMSKLIPSTALPAYDGKPVTYLDFVGVALIVTTFMAVSLARLVGAIRQEQLMGTLESLLVTPTARSTLQLGSVTYDLLYAPVRAALFFLALVGIMGVDMHLSGLLPMTVVILVFVPFLWGLGVTSAAAVLAFRHGGSAIGIGAALLTLVSGAYFPVEYLPGWLEAATRWNPVTIALDACRDAVLGHASWADMREPVLTLLPMAAVSLAMGLLAFKTALRYEIRRGTLGLY